MRYMKKKYGQFHICEANQETWNKFWPRVNFANLMQSWEYGDAKAKAEGWKPLRFILSDEASNPVALAQVLVRSLPIIGGIFRLNRGPLLIDLQLDDPKRNEIIIQSIDSLLRLARCNRWWIFLVAPEIQKAESVENELRKLGLKRRKSHCWASGRLSLLLSEDVLMKSIKGKWRNMLRKAQKMELDIRHHECTGDNLDILLRFYEKIQREKGFKGISDELLYQLCHLLGPTGQINLYSTSIKKSPDLEYVGMLVSVRHADTMTYLISYTDKKGRSRNANYLMLWQAILDAKRQGCIWFDLGGINENTTPGVIHFKKGLNAEFYHNSGEYSNNRLVSRVF